MNDAIDFKLITEHGPQTYERDYEFTATDLARPEVVGTASARMEVTVDVGDLEAEFVADGTMTFTTDLECSRCVEPTPFANTSSFHVRFRPRPEVSADEEIEITEEELDVEFYSEPAILLRDLALEQVQLSIPMKPLCDEGCLGLCPVCGVNRTREACSCGESVVDERWGALREMRDALAKKKDI